jgi:hypothetical protein
MRIPLDRRIAKAYSEGHTLVDVYPEYEKRFQRLFVAIGELVVTRNGASGQ